MKKTILLSVAVVLVTGVSVKAAVERHVPDPYPTIYAAVLYADSGDTIVIHERPEEAYKGVCTGTGTPIDPYEWHYAIDPGIKNLTFTSTNPDNPDVVADTKISGYKPSDDCGPEKWTRACNFESSGNQSILQGLTILAGPDDSTLLEGTAAIYCDGAHPTIRKCIIKGGLNDTDLQGIYCNNSQAEVNDCTITGLDAVCAIKVTGDSSNVDINACNIVGNSVTVGGIYHTGGDVNIINCVIWGNAQDGVHSVCSQSNLTITNSIILGNQYRGIYCLLKNDSNLTMNNNCVVAYNGGGGIFIGSGEPNVLIDDCTFYGNFSTGSGGGIHIYKGDPAIVSGCTITHNQAASGGGIYIQYADTPVKISKCTISDNIATAGSGGGIHNYSGEQLRVENCKITNNNAPYASAPNGGGGVIFDNGGPTIKNCLITGNKTNGSGGGINVYNCGPSTSYITNCTIADNDAAKGGGIMAPWIPGSGCSSVIEVRNCIIWGNDAPVNKQIHNEIDTLLHVDYSDVEGGWSGTGTGNINADPHFVANYHLRIDSEECIDAGDPSYVPEQGETDIDGDDRVLDGDSDEILEVDMGADEYTGLTTGINGGGIYCKNASPTISSCVIADNHCTGSGGGVYCESSASPTITNCVFSNNRADWYGGGMGNVDSTATLVNCVFNSNKAEVGGGILNRGSSSTLNATNCILWGDMGGDEISNYHSASANVTYCDVQDGYSGTGNINANPYFADADNPAGPDNVFGTVDDGLRLQPVSSSTIDNQCIDAGTNTPTGGLPETDIEGNPRKLDGDRDASQTIIVDMGAYEARMVWYVKSGLTGTGRSWDTAFGLQNALANSISGDEIWVAQETYKPHESDRSVSFQLRAGVGVYGGFTGVETARCQRDWKTNETVLSGDLNGDDEPDFINRSDNSYHVVKGANGAVLDGFTITGGYANGNSHYLDKYGAGILSYQRSPTINNCIIKDNKAEPQNYGGGGGMFILSDVGVPSSPTVMNCFFVDNSAYIGGGIYTESSNPNVVNCVFVGNKANARGGGFISLASSCNLINCTFNSNKADNGGGGMFSGGTSTPEVTNCIFWGNVGPCTPGEYDWREIRRQGSQLTFNYCDVNGCGGSGASWNEDFGNDGGGNIENDPKFVDASDPCGPDDKFRTMDDGLRIMPGSSCIDAATGFLAPSTDILDRARVDTVNVDNNGIGDPNYTDIGAYEFPMPAATLVRVYTNSSYDDNYGYGLWDCQVHFGHKDGTGDCAEPNLFIEVDWDGGDPDSWTVRSESDPTGFAVTFTETGSGTNRYRIDDPIHLAYNTNSGNRELKVDDEETLSVKVGTGGPVLNGPEVDRGEVATITADVTPGVDQTLTNLAAEVFDQFFDKDEPIGGPHDYYWWDYSDVLDEPRGVCSDEFSKFVKNVGESMEPLLPADFLLEIAHGVSDETGEVGNFGCPGDPKSIIHKPYTGTPTIEDTDWVSDIEWAVFYSCDVLGEAGNPDAWMTYWQKALIRQPVENKNNCHGILASSNVLKAHNETKTINYAKLHMEKFRDAMKDDGSTIIDAYMDSAADADVEQWGAAALFHLDNVDDYLNDVTPDTDDPVMFYTWFAESDETREKKTLGAGILGFQADKWAKVVCMVPTERPLLYRVQVHKESPHGKPFEPAGFDKAEFDNTGRVQFKKHLWERGPLRLSEAQAKTRAASFIAQRGGGMPFDAEMTVTRQQMVATYDALAPEATRDEYVRKVFFEYTHSIDDIQIAGGHRGDSILVTVAGNQVVGLRRRWRSIVGPTGSLQQVISASDALDVAVENIPRVILFPRDKGYSITEIKLFYYGLPSVQEQQYLTPAWGFEVNGFLWVYVNAFTGEFLD